MKRPIVTAILLPLILFFSASNASATVYESADIKVRLDAVSMFWGGTHRVYTSLASDQLNSAGGIVAGCNRSLFIEFDDKQLYAAVLEAAASQRTVYVMYNDGLPNHDSSPYGTTNCQLIGIKIR